MSKRNYFLKPRIYDWDFILHWYRRKDLYYLLNKISKMPNYKHFTVLDFGSGSQQYRSLFENIGIKYIGVDTEGNPDILIKSDGKIPLPDQSVDIVISLQVLEHLENVSDYISESARILKSEGILWLTTHGMWHYHPGPTDYFRWTLDGLRWQVLPKFTVREDDAMIGTLAYAPFSYLKLFYLITRQINKKQNNFFNLFSKNNRWGKFNRKNRIRIPPLFYLGNCLIYLVSIILNPLIFLLELMTPKKLKKLDAALFRIECLKKS